MSRLRARTFFAAILVVAAATAWSGLGLAAQLGDDFPAGQAGQRPSIGDPTALSADGARRAALARVQAQVDSGRAPEWAGAELGPVLELFDLSGAISAYLFPVSQGPTPAGYLTVAAVALPNPVLEFTTTGDNPLSSALVSARSQAATKGLSLASGRPLYLGLLEYALEVMGADGARRVMDLRTGEVTEVRAAADTVRLTSALRAQGQVADTTEAAEYVLIEGVPDWNQFLGEYGCYSGCAPTAATDVMGYWDQRGYEALIDGRDWRGAINEMRTAMGTWCIGLAGATYDSRIAPGMVSYVRTYGYDFVSQQWGGSAASFAAYQAEMNAGHPMVVGIHDHPTYQDHAITGVGYQTSGSYMIIHDNWPSTPENVYLQYGTGYSSIVMFPVRPANEETPTPTAGGTPTPSRTGTRTATATASRTPTETRTATRTATVTASPSHTATPTAAPTRTATPTARPSETSTATSSATSSPTATPTRAPSETPTATQTSTSTATSTTTSTSTATSTSTRTATPSASNTPTSLPSPSATSSPTGTATATATPSAIAPLPPAPRLRLSSIMLDWTAPTAADTPTPVPPARSVTVLGNHMLQHDHISWLHVLGEVYNGTAANVRDVTITVRFVASDGRELAAATASVGLSALPPGQRTCFHVVKRPVLGMAAYSFDPPAYSEGGALSQFTLRISEGAYEAGTGWYRLSGEVRNDETTPAGQVGVVGTLYDQAGVVVGCEAALVRQPELMPGQSGAFELLYSWRDYADVWSYRTQAAARP